MTMLILERVTPSMRGEITRWLVQIKAGVFVGYVSARVRDLLWLRVNKTAATAGGILIYADNTEQGFTARSFGDPSKTIEDFEGIFLAKTRKKA